MALIPVDSTYGAALIELEDIGNSVESLVRLVESQKELFHSQIDQLQKIVVRQCKLTGANPLAQEMAAGALSVNIGKRPRDLLNPKAVKYMQSIFSIKDTIGKKETREISALCGITVTQVRDYFSSQRSRVRKLVRLSQEKATKCDAPKTITEGSSDSPNKSASDSKDIPLNEPDCGVAEECTQTTGLSGDVASVSSPCPAVPLNVIPVCAQFPGNQIKFTSVYPQVHGNSGNVTSLWTQIPRSLENFPTAHTEVTGSWVNAVPVGPGNAGSPAPIFTPIFGFSGTANAVGMVVPGSPMNVTPLQEAQPGLAKASVKPAEEGPSCSSQEETTPGVDSDDKKFLENIFNLMRKEKTFSGRVKLMEWVLQINNSAVLCWFSTKGGITILSAWLSEAAHEEQTTVLLVIFKVLCHLPLNKAQPAQMSTILQTVNRLRFYRSSDISNRAKVLLTRWSKMFFRSQNLRNSKSSTKNGQKGLVHNQRNDQVLGDESWQSKLDIPEEILALAESANDSRETEPKKALKLLTDSSDGCTRKHSRTVSANKTKERRKVLLVEHPDSTGGRSPPVARAIPSNHSRPMSADDIQKAKLRAIHMQDKYGKSNVLASEDSLQKTEDRKSSPASHGTTSLPVNKIAPQLPHPRRTKAKKTPVPTDNSLPQKTETSKSQKLNLTPQEQLFEELKKNSIQWRVPPEAKLNSSWRIGAGENSKEVQIQTQRNRREKETIYKDLKDIPLNPKEPWDVEMDFDDSLTPEIPIDQPPDSESPLCSPTGLHPAVNAMATVVDDSPSMPSAAAGLTVTVPPLAATSSAVPEPDTELLMVLLKNPEVVDALTKGEGRNLSEEQLVALLDMVKKSGTGATGILDGLADITGAPRPIQSEPEPEAVSFPSPTPPSRATWRPEFPLMASNSALQPQFASNRGSPVPSLSSSTPSSSVMPMSINNLPQTVRPLSLASRAPTTMLSPPQLTINHLPQQQQHHHVPNPNFLPMKQPHSVYQALQHSRAPPEENFLTSHQQFNRPSTSATLHPGPLRSTWPPADSFADFPRLDPMPDYRNGRVLDDSVTTNSIYYANHNNYNSNSNNVYPRVNDYAPGRRMGAWNPEGTPVGLSEFREFPNDGRDYAEPREFDQGHGLSRQRQWRSGQPGPYRGGGNGGRKWRDWDRGR